MTLLESGEMYLESIYVLSLTSSSVRGIDVGEYLGYSKPSVSRGIGLLKKEGLVETDADGYLVLTPEGKERAAKIYERHTLIAKMLMSLGVDEKTATEDACRVEHYISDTTFAAIKQHFTDYSSE